MAQYFGDLIVTDVCLILGQLFVIEGVRAPCGGGRLAVAPRVANLNSCYAACECRLRRGVGARRVFD